MHVFLLYNKTGLNEAKLENMENCSYHDPAAVYITHGSEFVILTSAIAQALIHYNIIHQPVPYGCGVTEDSPNKDRKHMRSIHKPINDAMSELTQSTGMYMYIGCVVQRLYRIQFLRWDAGKQWFSGVTQQ